MNGQLSCLLGVVVLCACSDSLDALGGSGCTEIGCLTFLRVELETESELTGGGAEVMVEHDGKSFKCEFGAVDDPCHKGFQPDFDPGSTSGGATQTDVQVIVLDDTPEEVRITVTVAGRSETEVLRPQYQKSQPNGAGCEPTCLSASARAEFGL